MASPSVVQVAESATITAGTSHTVDRTAAVAVGDLLILIGDKGSTAATVNAHTDWTELLDENLANGLYIAYRWATGAEPTTWTIGTSANTRMAWTMYRISGAAHPLTQAPQIGTTATGTSVSPNPPSVSVTGGSKDILTIACFGRAGEEADDDTWVTVVPTGFAGLTQKACGIAGTNLGGMIATANDQATTATSDPATFTAATGQWRAQTIVIHPPAAAKTTSIAETSLASASLPASVVPHVIKVRARKTTTQSGTIRARLYEGATARSAELETSELTTSLADYTLNIADADAEDITSYTNLSVRFRGYSANGDPTVFEVAEIWLEIPASAVVAVPKTLTSSYNVQTTISKTLVPSYNVQASISKTVTSSFTIITGAEKTLTASYSIVQQITKTLTASFNVAGGKQTTIAEVSLASGLAPVTRTDHVINFRARKTSSLEGTIKARLYEGANPISAELETSQLTTSLADYSLDIADADAEDITNYANLSVRFYGYSADADTTTFEIAEIWLEIPVSGVTTVTKSLAATYNVTKIVSKTLTAGYDVISFSQAIKSLSASYNIIGVVAKTLTAGFNIVRGKNTTLAEVSLAVAEEPSIREEHYIKLRARKTSSLDGTILARLYEGTTPRSALLETSQLTTSLAEYTLSIADTDAAGIVSYDDLSIRFVGYSATGNTTAFEIAEVWLEIPASVLTDVSKFLAAIYGIAGPVQKTLTASYEVESLYTIKKFLVVNYEVIEFGQTYIAKVSMAPASTPFLREEHSIKVRARVSSGTGVLKAALYDGTTNISGNLSTPALTGTLTEYSLPIADIDAENITQYQDLELRFWGVGAGATYEISEIWLDIPGGLAFVNKNLTANYDIELVSVQKNLAATYALGGPTRKQLIVTPYVIQYGPRGLANLFISENIAAIRKDLVPAYGIGGSTQKSLSINYNVTATVSKILNFSYDIEVLSIAIPKSLSVSYNVINTISKHLIPIYGLGNVVVKPLTSNYTVRELVTQPLAVNYILIKIISKTLNSQYKVQKIVTKNFATSYWVSSQFEPAPPYPPTGSIDTPTPQVKGVLIKIP